MRLEDIFEAKADYSIFDKRGRLRAKWNNELLDEEGEDYLPDGCTKILELEVIESSRSEKGYGTSLMNEFLASGIAKSADMIFLDPNPYMGIKARSAQEEQENLERLMNFYRKFGFRNHPKSTRMWLVQKGHIADADLPQ